MWDSLGPTIIDRIITLNKQDFIGFLSILKVPSMTSIGFDSPRLINTIRVNPCSGNKVTLRYGIGVRNAERISEDGLNRTPNVDDLKAFLEKFVSVIWEKVLDGVLGGLIRLVDVNTFSWAKYISNSSVAPVYR